MSVGQLLFHDMAKLLRKSNGQFQKGIHPKTQIKRGDKLALGYKWTEEQKKNRISPMLGHTPWNKGLHKATNSGRTHFKKGIIPWNYKGGISKTRDYINFYKRRYKAKKRNALGDHTFGEWETLKAQYNWICPCCHKSEPKIKLTEDHIIPLSRGGSNNI